MVAKGGWRSCPVRKPALKGRLSIAETNPKTLASMFAQPDQTTGASALTRLSGDVSIAYSDGALKLDPAPGAPRWSTLNGHVHLPPSLAGPTIRTRLELDRSTLIALCHRQRMRLTTGRISRWRGGGRSVFAALRARSGGEFKIGRLTISKAKMVT